MLLNANSDNRSRRFCFQIDLLQDLQQGNDQQCHNIDALDQRLNRRTGGIFARITDRITGDCSGMGSSAFTAMMAILDIFLGVIPGANGQVRYELKTPYANGTR